MTRKELTDKYRKDLAEGKPVHGEARDMVIDDDLDEIAKKNGLLIDDKSVVNFLRLRSYLRDMEHYANSLAFTTDNTDFLAGYRLALRQTIEFITEMKE